MSQDIFRSHSHHLCKLLWDPPHQSTYVFFYKAHCPIGVTECFWVGVNSWKIVDLLMSHPQKLSVANSSSTSGETSWIPLLSILELRLGSAFIGLMLAVITTMSSCMHLPCMFGKLFISTTPGSYSLSAPSFGMNSAPGEGVWSRVPIWDCTVCSSLFSACWPITYLCVIPRLLKNK